MKREIRDEWVRRLRSGEYEQGQGALAVDDKFCCLGVLCEIAVDEGIVVKKEFDQNTAPKIGYGITGEPSGSTSYLPYTVAYWANIKGVDNWGVDSNPRVMHDGVFKPLSDLNDGGLTFAQIADLIEENF